MSGVRGKFKSPAVASCLKSLTKLIISGSFYGQDELFSDVANGVKPKIFMRKYLYSSKDNLSE